MYVEYMVERIMFQYKRTYVDAPLFY